MLLHQRIYWNSAGRLSHTLTHKKLGGTEQKEPLLYNSASHDNTDGQYQLTTLTRTGTVHVVLCTYLLKSFPVEKTGLELLRSCRFQGSQSLSS